ncbi:hypothetical protein ALC60_10730 [Trachymyrmex zeteki]|uniref:Uncharacterized protein n=1 Tax=Mycetomoellerius zeteki TaxID=64791 RepID=A0A151WQS5_9HYME|nr:hypothetical protein ALC60_10730 [Trachymyrmex zeteki]
MNVPSTSRVRNVANELPRVKSECFALRIKILSLKDTSATSLTYLYVQFVPYLLAWHPTHLSCTSFQNYAKCVEIRVHSCVTSPLMYNGYVSGLLRMRLRANVFLAVACTLPLYYLRLAATSNN